VLVVDKAAFPRDKTCGDGLTTAALRLIEHLGVDITALPGYMSVRETVLVAPDGRRVSLPLGRDGDYAAVVPPLDLDAPLRPRPRPRRCGRAAAPPRRPRAATAPPPRHPPALFGPAFSSPPTVTTPSCDVACARRHRPRSARGTRSVSTSGASTTPGSTCSS